MKNFLKKIKDKIFSQKKNWPMVVLVLALVVVSFSAGNIALAAGDGWVSNILSSIVSAFYNFILWLLGLLIAMVIGLARYSGFTTAAAVVSGWVIVRDICNLFFIIILLVIAFSTILRVGGYSIKETLPKLLIMAVLINFSKTICGLIIDVAQIVMLAFLSQIKDVAAGSFSEMFAIPKLEMFNDSTTGTGANAFTVFSSYALALIMVLISAVVLVVFIGVLTMRIVMLWIYVVLSPLAYFLSTFPQGASYAKKWWSDFTENVIIGPVLAFFLWLAFVSVGSSSQLEGLPTDLVGPEGLTAISKFEPLAKFAVSIGMLIGGLMISQSMAGGVGKIAGAGLAKINAGAGWTKKKVTGAAVAGGAAVVGAGVATGKIGLGTLDRLAGAGIAATMKPDNKLKATAMSGISSLAMAGIKQPGRAIEKLKNKVLGDRDLNRARHEQFMKVQGGDKNAKLSLNDKKWMWDDSQKVFVNEKNNAEVLKNGKKSVKKMDSFEAAIHQSVSSSVNKVRAVSDKVKEEKVESKSKEFKNLDAGQQLAIMENSGANDIDRIAAANVLSEGGNLRNKKDADLAKKITSGLKPIFEKVEDSIDKKQTAYNYDMSNEGDVDRFKKRLEKGKIDLTNLPTPLYKADNTAMFLAAKDNMESGEFKKAIESAFKKSGRDGRDNISKLLPAMRDTFVGKAEESLRAGDATKAKEYEDAAAKSSILHVELTGNIENSFEDADATNGFNEENLKAFFQRSKAVDINGLNMESLGKFLNNHGAAAERAVVESMSYNKLKALNKQGENMALVVKLRDMMKAAGHRDSTRIDNDDDISTAVA
ncbi:MAG: hypothetical protein WC415_02150 [Patescibacteria group bacterium]|jgi:hypothetical protein